MYGLVNTAIEEMVTSQFGIEKWNEIKSRSGVAVDAFISNEPYPDDITFGLVVAASEVLNIPTDDVLFAFGEYWVLNTGMEKYNYLMKAGGSNLKDFLINLPHFHNRVILMYPKLVPPEFKITDVGVDSLNLHYFSNRVGLQNFVTGLLSGLGKVFGKNIKVIHARDEKTNPPHDVFNIQWKD
jgi:Haem-NO-binding